MVLVHMVEVVLDWYTPSIYHNYFFLPVIFWMSWCIISTMYLALWDSHWYDSLTLTYFIFHLLFTFYHFYFPQIRLPHGPISFPCICLYLVEHCTIGWNFFLIGMLWVHQHLPNTSFFRLIWISRFDKVHISLFCNNKKS